MSFGVRKAPTGCNFVHNDEIWKDHVKRELQTSGKWPDVWGFLSQGPPSKLAKHPAAADQSSVQLPVEDAGSLVTLLDQAHGEDKLKGRSSSYPHTTAGEIGWRSADFSKLERFGRHARGQQGIRHLLNWPREAVY